MDFFAKNWYDTISLIIAICALVVSIYANHKVEEIHRQDKQEPLYADVDRLLNYKCDFYSAELKAMCCYTAAQSVSLKDEGRIKREVCRYFGKSEYNQLCSILDLCNKAKSIDSDIGLLFDLIKERDSEQYDRLIEILRQECMISDFNRNDVTAFLSTVSIPFYKDLSESEGKAYDYLELRNSLDSINIKITNQREKLNESMEKILKKK